MRGYGLYRRGGADLALALVLTACAAPNPSSTAAGPSAPFARAPLAAEASMPIVATVGEEELGVDEFLTECLQEDSALMRRVLERVVLSRLVELEAQRLEVVLPPDVLALAQATAIMEVVDTVEEESPGADFDTWVATRLGLDPVQFKERLKLRVKRELLAKRVVRTWFLGQDRAEVRILLAADLEAAEGALERHRAGEDFGELAKELSVDISAEDGGRVPPVIRAETLLGTIAFETELGAVAGPLEQPGRWLLVEVIARREGAPGLWSEVRERVEESLLERGVEDAEYWQWKERMQGIHPVDVTPLFRLAGEPDL